MLRTIILINKCNVEFLNMINKHSTSLYLIALNGGSIFGFRKKNMCMSLRFYLKSAKKSMTGYFRIVYLIFMVYNTFN